MSMLGKNTTITFGRLTGTEHKLPCLFTIGDIALNASQVEDTCYGTSQYRTYIQGLKEPGIVDLTTNYIPFDTASQALKDAFRTGEGQVFIITLPDGSTTTFKAVIKSYTRTYPKDDVVRQTFGIQISGEPDYKDGPVPETVVVEFDANGGTGIMQPVGVATATQYTIPACTFTAPNGKQFAVWIDEAGQAHDPADTVNLKRDTTLTATWEATT